jgi:hypothetical protein
VTLAESGDAGEFEHLTAQEGVEVVLEPSRDQVKVGNVGARFMATSTCDDRESSWAAVAKTFDPPLDLGDRQALGVWVYGDGRGELLNIQVRSPEHVGGGIGEHYVTVDLTGWRYFELIEPEGKRWADYSWPYGAAKSIYRRLVDYRQLAHLSLRYNNLPKGNEVTCYLSPVRALPVANITLRNPAVTLGGATITFPVEMKTGCYLEFRSMDDCKLYDRTGRLLADVRPTGLVPALTPGENEITFTCDPPANGASTRAYVTVMTEGQTL